MNSDSPADDLPRTGAAKPGLYFTYQKYDPVRFPSPTQPPSDLVTPMMEWMMMSGEDGAALTEDQLRRAIRLDPSQLGGIGPSLQSIRRWLLERKQKILSTYEAESALADQTKSYANVVRQVKPPKPLEHDYRKAAIGQQLYGLERLWYRLGDQTSHFARHLMKVIGQLETLSELQQLNANYPFTGRQELSPEEAIEVKQELEKIDELLKQLDEAEQTGQVGIIDLDELRDFVQDGDPSSLDQIRQLLDSMIEQIAEREGLDKQKGRWQLSPKAMRLYQSRLLSRIFSQLQASRSGRHNEVVAGEGAVELSATKPYEFGDALSAMDWPQSLTNALLRQGGQTPLRFHSDDLQLHRTQNRPKCATVVIGDMSGSMRYDSQYVNVKRMALALDGLIRTEYPGDSVKFIEMYTFAKQKTTAEFLQSMPKTVTIHDPVVQLRYDMSRDDITESMIHPHFTNIQRSLELARKLLEVQPTPNRQIILITDGLPTAHCEGQHLYLLYPPHPLTEQATLREAQLCHRAGITINIFLIPSWSQSEEDIRFAYKLAQQTKGRVFFTAGKDLDRFVVWDYVSQRREIIS